MFRFYKILNFAPTIFADQKVPSYPCSRDCRDDAKTYNTYGFGIVYRRHIAHQKFYRRFRSAVGGIDRNDVFP